MESILTSIKKLLGIGEDVTDFDTDIIIHINSVFTTLTQLGVGPSTGFYIEDASAIWDDYIEDAVELQAVKTYIFLKVKLVFDPASIGSATLAAYERQINELEWRLNTIAESKGNSSGGSADSDVSNVGDECSAIITNNILVVNNGKGGL